MQQLLQIGDKEPWIFQDNKREVSLVGSIKVQQIFGREQKVFYGNFNICWCNYEPICWPNVVNVQKYIQNHLEEGYAATIDYDLMTISIVAKTTLKKAQIINLSLLKLKIGEALRKITPHIIQCLHLSGMINTINNNYFHFIKINKSEKRRLNDFLNELLLRKEKISLVQNPCQNNHFSLVFQQDPNSKAKLPQREHESTTYSSYQQSINKQLEYFVNFFKQRALKNSNKKIQIIKRFNSKRAEIEVQGGISKILKIKIQQDYEGNKKTLYTSDLRMIKIESGLLAKKCFRKGQNRMTQPNNLMRFEREKQIITYLSEKRSIFKDCYLMNYYFQQDSNNSDYYADWHQLSLSAYLKLYQNQLRLLQKLHLAIQILLILIDLHSLGVVHRDLKSSNFMIDIQGGQPLLKLIDMSDSIIIDNQEMLNAVINQNPKLFSTPLFCPIETSTLHEKHHQIGLNRTEIDRWSVGILLYEIFNGSIPISQSPLTSKDILNLWPTQFLQGLSLKDKNNARMVQKIIGYLQFSLLKINQSERMNLQLCLTILLQCYRYLKQLQSNHFFYHVSQNPQIT